MQISLSLSLDQVNVVLNSLSEQPFKAVSSTVAEIQQQTVAQIKAAENGERERLVKEAMAQELYKQEMAKNLEHPEG